MARRPEKLPAALVRDLEVRRNNVRRRSAGRAGTGKPSRPSEYLPRTRAIERPYWAVERRLEELQRRRINMVSAALALAKEAARYGGPGSAKDCNRDQGAGCSV